MLDKSSIKKSSISVLDIASWQNLMVELDAPAEELVSGGTGRSIQVIPLILGTLNTRASLGDVTPIEEIGTIGSSPYEGCDPGTCC